MGARKDKKETSKKGKDKVKGGKVNPPEEIPAEHSDGEEIQEGEQEKNQETIPREKPVETQPEEEADEEVDEELPSMKRRKKTPKLNLGEEQEEDLLNWYKVNEILSIIKIKGNSRIRPRRTRWCQRRSKNCIYLLLI